MSITTNTKASVAIKLDYSLTGENATIAIERGLAEADWYQCPVPREMLRKLLERRDGPALCNTAMWIGLLFASAFVTYYLWGTWWAAFPYFVYATLYASTSDSRWHETGHGTAFKTDWMNNALYEVSSFMVMRESVVWRWSHTRHHSDTIIVGRDPEIAVPRPPDLLGIILKMFGLKGYKRYFRSIIIHSMGRMDAEERTYIPRSENGAIFLRARIYLVLYVSVLALAIGTRSVLPVMFVGAANLFGTWLMVVYGMTQHAGLAENVLDHRLNCRTIYMSAINRFLYWNMNYHVEHHMYPLVPFHALPALHELVKEDCPPPYPSLASAWREIIPTILRQVKDPSHHIRRTLPHKIANALEITNVVTSEQDAEGWLQACSSSELMPSDIKRIDYKRETYVVCRDEGGKLFALDGICTHGNVHLAAGLLKDGILECPKHNGRYHLIDGSPARVPICQGLAVYPVQERSGFISINFNKIPGVSKDGQKRRNFRVVSNRNIATFIKELVIDPQEADGPLSFEPGDYLQFVIPKYETIRFAEFDIAEPFSDVWRRHSLFDLVASNVDGEQKNNYSLASNNAKERLLRFNVRIAMPPPGQNCPPGIGSSYLFSLAEDDIVQAYGPFGDFHIKPTHREMIYVGGGAGMAPLRAHISHLLETENSPRKISFWYGARSKQELFYEEYFRGLSDLHQNFSFCGALSSPLQEDAWKGPTGFIHEVLHEAYLAGHEDPRSVEYYLCGPPMMIKATTKLLMELGVPRGQIAFDEF